MLTKGRLGIFPRVDENRNPYYTTGAVDSSLYMMSTSDAICADAVGKSYNTGEAP